MGHSAGWLDARWLAGQVYAWMFSDLRPPEIVHFGLVGIRNHVALLVGPVGGKTGTRTLTFTFTTESLDAIHSGPSDPTSILREMLHSDRYLVMSQESVDIRFEKPRRLRLAGRQMLASGRELKKGEFYPALVQHFFVFIDKRSTLEEVAVQFAIILSQWNVIPFQEEDRRAIASYLSNLFRNPETFVAAANEAVSFLFSNWIFPQRWLAFRTYARRTVWGIYAQAGRFFAETNSRGEDWAENESVRKKSGKLRRASRRQISVSELAMISGISRRTLYDSIKRRKLRASKEGMSLRVSREAAGILCTEAEQRRKIRSLKKYLVEAGIGEAGLRKKIYRLRKEGTSSEEIVKHLVKLIPSAKTIRSHLRD
jgi:hypothetical protein